MTIFSIQAAEGSNIVYTCQAVNGITWRDWVNSAYNNIGAYIGTNSNGEEVVFIKSSVYLWISSPDNIINGGVYAMREEIV